MTPKGFISIPPREVRFEGERTLLRVDEIIGVGTAASGVAFGSWVSLRTGGPIATTLSVDEIAALIAEAQAE